MSTHFKKTKTKLESELQTSVIDYAKRRRWFVAKIGQAYPNGMPDLILHRKGVTIYIEMKRLGKEPDLQQRRRHAEIRAQDVPVFVIDRIEDAITLLQ